MANSDYGAIPLTIAESTSEALNTKLRVSTGFKPSEWANAIASIPTPPALTSNLWGGLQMAVDIPKNCDASAYTINPDDGYVSLTAGWGIEEKECISGIFESNTQYTLILTFENSTGGQVQTNIGIVYTDNTVDALNISGSSADTKYTVAFVSQSGKTISKIETIYADGSSKIYYDESGLFEGVKTTDDFEPYNRYNT